MSMKVSDRNSASSRWTVPALAIILMIAAWLRFDGLNWDEGTHLHPDERFLTTVEAAIQPTFSLGEYFSTATSPLNPYNRGHNFFVYGTFPIFAVRYVAEGLNTVCLSSPTCNFFFTGYDGVHLVGRALSALADLGSVLVLFLIGRRLHSDRVGLLAAALGAVTVLPIQQAHFFTVDTFLMFFVTGSLYFAVRVLQDGEWRDWILFGITFGMALACKISVWPMALLLIAAALIRQSRLRYIKPPDPVIGLVVAGLITFLTFRTLQPYSFAGPNFTRETLGDDRFNTVAATAPEWWTTAHRVIPEPFRAIFLPAPEWLANMRTIQDQMGGDVDFPPNHQWTDRRPILFPWMNMVLYGMGPLLGLAGWAGWGVAILQLVRKQSRSFAWDHHFLLVLWTALFFLYQGTQWVKSMRYQLPVYPGLVLLAAWLLVYVSDRNSARHRTVEQGESDTQNAPAGGRIELARRWAARGMLVLVLAGTLLWALSFTNVYRQTFTRVAASRWIYENVPTGATLLYERTDAGNQIASQLQIHIPIVEYFENGVENVTRFTMPADGIVTGLQMNYLSDPLMDPEGEVFRVAVRSDLGSGTELVSQQQIVDLQHLNNVRGGTFHFPLDRTTLSGGQTYYLVTEAVNGAPIRSTGAYLVNETSWDDGLPWRVDGLDGFSIYEGAPLELYWEDEASKKDRMIELLDKGEYLFVSSTRQLGSITRLPPRYPLTIAYYQALFEGRLGYELVKTFTADIHVGPLLINDVFGKLGWDAAPNTGWPPPGTWAAEEAFSVYDHPPVWIFKKQADYSPVQTRAILDAVDLSNRRFVIPLDYTEELKSERAPWPLNLISSTEESVEEERSMFFSPETAAEQRAGGTWSEIFDAEGLLSSYHWLGATVWWLLVLALGWLTFPIAFLVFGGLPSKGYAISKTLALLLLSWLTWISASINLLPYSRGTIWLAIGLLAAVGVGIGWWRRRAILPFIRTRWRLVLTVEVAALLLYIISLLIRSGNPDLWHPHFGGEKPMNFAMLNAVLKSTSFPPYDAWLSGAYLNYYYYGYVMIGNLIKVLGIVPNVAYNLALPMLFSLTGIGAFSISFDLVEGVRRSRAGETLASWSRKALMAGLVAAIMVVLLGNLGQVWTIVNGWSKLGGSEGSWTTQVGRGLVRNLQGDAIPIYTGSWYWDATRIIPPGEGEPGPITEFPFFTFLYADLHAHMMDMPLVLLALAWALHLAQSADRYFRKATGVSGREIFKILISLLMGGLVIGVLRATNTWDWPTMLGVGAVATSYASWRYYRGRRAWILGALLGIGAIAGTGALLFLPYSQNFVPAYTEVMRWNGGITPIWSYVAVNGLFLFILLTLLGLEYFDWTRHLTEEKLRALEPYRWLILLGTLVFLGAMAGTLLLGVPVGPIVILFAAPAGLLALQPRLAAERRAVLMLLTLGLVLTLAVELIVLSGDIGRMNTVFKFYIQVWLIFSAIGGAALIWVWDAVRRWHPLPRQTWTVGLLVLVLFAATYPPTAASAKIRDRFHADQPPAGLDGMAYMLTATHHDRDQAMELKYDYEVIRWLQDNVIGSPVIMEANTYPKIYGWGNRISINTGLPSVVGWEWHTRQHRAGFPDASEQVRRRANDVIAFYSTADVQQATMILDTYDVKFVIVGLLERAYYDPTGIAKFDLMVEQQILIERFRNEGAVVYEVR